MDLLIGVLGSIIASIVVTITVRWYRKKVTERERIKTMQEKESLLGKTFLEQGLTKFHFSRDDYGRTLASFLEKATFSICLVSISLKITDDEGQLTSLFKRKLSANQNFTISISLLNPNNQFLIKVAADTLNVTAKKLKSEISEMLSDLLDCYDSLNSSEQTRFKILVHDCFPMGSVVMLDALPSGGMIQIETKLYKAPRTASFGFQLTKESSFYKHHFLSWHRIIQDSKPITKEQLIKKNIRSKVFTPTKR